MDTAIEQSRWLVDDEQGRRDKAYQLLASPYHPPLEEVKEVTAYIASPDGLWQSDRQKAFDKAVEVLAGLHPPNFVESVKAKAKELKFRLGRERAFQKAAMLSYGGGGCNHGGYNHGGYNNGGYNRGGYNQGGYNQGGYNGGSYGHHNRW
ncbi:unnamed protein product [Durusdinium trenchii]|uniref:Uncharacterized protein n=1 Tax=Durusdinium trenchii TaxID=1381693 RepID=A0ABP0I6T4_9DINO